MSDTDPFAAAEEVVATPDTKADTKAAKASDTPGEVVENEDTTPDTNEDSKDESYSTNG